MVGENGIGIVGRICFSRLSRRATSAMYASRRWAAGVPAAQRNASTRDFTEPSTARRLALRNAAAFGVLPVPVPATASSRARASVVGCQDGSIHLLPLLRGRQRSRVPVYDVRDPYTPVRRTGSAWFLVRFASDINTSSETDVPAAPLLTASPVRQLCVE